MLQIKTIQTEDPTKFDNAVNQALEEGWLLAERKLVQTPAGTLDYLYAAMEKQIITEAERTCDNCKHSMLSGEVEPCASCSDDCDKWEAVE